MVVSWDLPTANGDLATKNDDFPVRKLLVYQMVMGFHTGWGISSLAKLVNKTIITIVYWEANNHI